MMGFRRFRQTRLAYYLMQGVNVLPCGAGSPRSTWCESRLRFRTRLIQLTLHELMGGQAVGFWIPGAE
ncbi:hypothetical protein PsorP6_016696 [Peronosclerospora sorghi]|uniref:Uncharacterized protein n=1 Tax=Peronosclerospora sorghi TaxID=230839 RepID=A0ACC0WD31_9STRA|nr:hypothetical protein PsorP6_016696 [Peronosclerospora sorghi]